MVTDVLLPCVRGCFRLSSLSLSSFSLGLSWYQFQNNPTMDSQLVYRQSLPAMSRFAHGTRTRARRFGALAGSRAQKRPQQAAAAATEAQNDRLAKSEQRVHACPAGATLCNGQLETKDK
jgi:hypothetical protein